MRSSTQTCDGRRRAMRRAVLRITGTYAAAISRGIARPEVVVWGACCMEVSVGALSAPARWGSLLKGRLGVGRVRRDPSRPFERRIHQLLCHLGAPDRREAFAAETGTNV